MYFVSEYLSWNLNKFTYSTIFFSNPVNIYSKYFSLWSQHRIDGDNIFTDL